jgi:hypothetical protein
MPARWRRQERRAGEMDGATNGASRVVPVMLVRIPAGVKRRGQLSRPRPQFR